MLYEVITDVLRVRRALAEVRKEDPRLIARAIELLGWDEVAHDAVVALRTIASRHIEVLAEALLDHDRDFAVRRRIRITSYNVCYTKLLRVVPAVEIEGVPRRDRGGSDRRCSGALARTAARRRPRPWPG